jgi:HEAT repeat protein
MKSLMTALGFVSLIVIAANGRAADREAEVAKHIKELKSTSAKTRAGAADEIGKIGEIKASFARAALEPLLDLLKDKDPSVRQAAATALSRIDEPKEVVPALETLLRDDKEQRVRAAAAAGLGLMGEASKEALPTLRKVAQESRTMGKTAQPLAQACNRAIQQITGRTKQQ